MSYLIAFISIFLGALAQYLLKIGTSQLILIRTSLIKALFLNIPLLGGLFCYGLSLIFWLYVLSKMELSKAYPMVSLGYVVTLLLGYIFLNEPLSLSKILGVSLIMIGVYFVTK